MIIGWWDAPHVHVDILGLHLLLLLATQGNLTPCLPDQVLKTLAAPHVERRDGSSSLQGGGLPLCPRPDQAFPESLERAERGLESYSKAAPPPALLKPDRTSDGERWAPTT